MSNLLCSDFYRLFKSKFFYICSAVSIFLMSVSVFIAKWAMDLTSKQSGVEAESPFKDGISYGITAFGSGDVQIIITIIVAIFVVSEFSHGTMKNVVSKGFSKIQIYFSKLITMVAATFILIFATFIASTICAAIVTGTFGEFTGGNVAEIFKTMGIEMLLNIAYVALLLFVSMLVRNLGGVIAINIIAVTMFGPLIFQLLEFAVKSKIKFTEFSLRYNMAFYLTNTADGSDYLRSTIVALVFFAVTTAIGIFAFIKSDVK